MLQVFEVVSVDNSNKVEVKVAELDLRRSGCNQILALDIPRTTSFLAWLSAVKRHDSSSSSERLNRLKRDEMGTPFLYVTVGTNLISQSRRRSATARFTMIAWPISFRPK
ncbi:hypothetical protein ACVWZ4_001267 [Bradyrhizobium sp. USDA 4472]